MANKLIGSINHDYTKKNSEKLNFKIENSMGDMWIGSLFVYKLPTR